MTETMRADALRIGTSAAVPGHVHGTEDVVADHGLLIPASLLDDDHPQYLPVNGTRAMTADLPMGAKKITNLAAPAAASDGARLDTVTGRIVNSISGGETDKAPTVAATRGYIDQRDGDYLTYYQSNHSPRLSGPHGPHTGYVDIPGDGSWTPYPGGALQTGAINIEGTYMLAAAAYLYIDGVTGNSASLYFGITCRWASGAALSWRNGNSNSIQRLTISKGAVTGRVSVYTQGYVDNRVGDTIVYAGAASRTDASASVFQMGGNYRLHHVFYPYMNRQDAGLSQGWIGYA